MKQMQSTNSKCSTCIHKSKVFKNLDSGGLKCSKCTDRESRARDYSWFVDTENYTEKELEEFTPNKYKF
jgi:hypothetical protein